MTCIVKRVRLQSIQVSGSTAIITTPKHCTRKISNLCNISNMALPPSWMLCVQSVIWDRDADGDSAIEPITNLTHNLTHITDFAHYIHDGSRAIVTYY